MTGGEPAALEPLDLRLTLPALAAWITAWQGRLLPVWALLLLAGLAAAGAGVVLLRRVPLRLLGRTVPAAVLAAVLACTAAAALATAARVGPRTEGPLAALAAREAAVAVEAVLTDDPRKAAPRAGPQGDALLVVVRLRVVQLERAGTTTRLRAPLLVLSSSEDWLDLLPSQRVRVEGRLQPAERGDDVAAVLAARGPPQVLGRPSAVQRAAGHLRAGLRRAVAPLPDAEGGLLPGLVVGDTSRLDPQVREDFRTTGLTHLTAVSGTNVAIVVGAVLLLCRRTGLGVRASPLLAGVALAGFVVLARPSPSVLRAGAMGVVGLLALSTGTRRAALPALSAAVLVLVLLVPDLAAAPGFALSVLATAGLLLLAPPWRERLARRMPGWLADAIAVPAAAQVACGPVVVAISAELGLLSVPANLLAVPAVAPATVLGVLCALIAPVWLPAAQVVAWLGYLPAAWLVGVARVGARMPLAGVGWPDGGRGAALLTLLTVAVWAAVVRPWARRVLCAGTAGVLVATTGLAAARPSWPPPGWLLVACDVGQGDATVLAAARGTAVLVDAGPEPEAVDGCLSRLDVDRLAIVVLSHLHADHVDGLPGALRGRSVGLVQTGPPLPAPAYDRVTAWAAAADVEVGTAALGERRQVAGLGWEVLAPSRAYRGTSSDPNNGSLVLLARTSGVTVLLPGDVEPEAQADLLATGTDLRVDVLKVPHHGSDHQDPALLAAAAPSIAISSLGADNTYGHPAAETVDQLLDQGARHLRTDRDGDVAVVLRDGVLRAVGRRASGEQRTEGREGRSPVPGPSEQPAVAAPSVGRSTRADRRSARPDARRR